jgi:hypothetical protein
VALPRAEVWNGLQPARTERLVPAHERTVESLDSPVRRMGVMATYSDFLLFHRTDQGIPAVTDPHGYHLANAAAKLRGLAAYTARHAEAFLRIQAVVETPERRLLALNLPKGLLVG